MSEGMKSGAGPDPFENDSKTGDMNEKEQTQLGRENENSDEQLKATPDDEGQSTDSSEVNDDFNINDLPYVLRRDTVKENRKTVSYFLRTETIDLERKAKRAAEKEFQTDVMQLDIREALVQVGGEHIDEVIEKLRESGYRRRE